MDEEEIKKEAPLLFGLQKPAARLTPGQRQQLHRAIYAGIQPVKPITARLPWYLEVAAAAAVAAFVIITGNCLGSYANQKMNLDARGETPASTYYYNQIF